MRVTFRVLDQTTKLLVTEVIKINHDNSTGRAALAVVTNDTEETNVFTIHVHTPVTRDTCSFESERHPETEESFVEEERNIKLVKACVDTKRVLKASTWDTGNWTTIRKSICISHTDVEIFKIVRVEV